MLLPRIIPVLLVHRNALYKTKKFTSHKYVGDPINAVKIFNEKGSDELVILDIDRSISGLEPDFEMIRKIAIASRMPICYGGGIKSVDHAEKIFKLGVEKVALSSSAIQNPSLLKDIASIVGAQSVVLVLDVKFIKGKYQIHLVLLPLRHYQV